MIIHLAKTHKSFAKVPIHWFVGPDVPVEVFTDAGRLQQVLANGLTNRCALAVVHAVDHCVYL